MIWLQYAPFVVLKNTANRPVVLAGNPMVGFRQPNLGFRFKRIGASLSGYITTSQVAADQMYVSASDRGDKTYGMTLYNQVLSNQASGSVKLAAGQTLVLSPFIDGFTVISSLLDWDNSKTGAIKAVPGWFGGFNGYTVDWLTGGPQNLADGLNGNLGVIVTRSADTWDVEAAYTGATNGWRVYKMNEDRSPVLEPNASMEITQFPYKLSDHREPVATSAIAVSSNDRAATTIMFPLFSALGPPNTASTLKVLSDSDGNGLSDEWEMEHFARLGVDPHADADVDHFSNLFEFLAGHSPVNGSDHFNYHLATRLDGNLALIWSTTPGRSYAIERSDDLRTWQLVGTKLGEPAPSLSSSFDLGPPTGVEGWFRIKLGGTAN